jgi:hypothetical protein
LIQHKIDLFTAGLEYNAAAGVSLADSRKAFYQYGSSFNLLRPTEERVVNLQRGFEWASGGVYATANTSVQLFALGSASRGIPRREWGWEIPLPEPQLMAYAFDPSADVIAFLELSEETQVRSP